MELMGGESGWMHALEVYQGSNGNVTLRYYAALEKLGIAGLVAVNLFRAQKCSARAKVYRGGIRGRGSFRGMAYDRKSWAMGELCRALALANDVPYGWKRDSAVLFGERPSWVLYVDLPEGQVSFHARERGKGPDYAGEWDGAEGASVERILAHCDRLLPAGILCEMGT
jgi:hypothetical protein